MPAVSGRKLGSGSGLRRFSSQCLRLIAIGLVVVVQLWLCGPSAAAQEVCRREFFDEPPHWILSAAWGGEGEGQDLILVDAINRKIQRFSQDGRSSFLTHHVNHLPRFQPISLTPTSEGFILRMAGNRFVPVTGSSDRFYANPARVVALQQASGRTSRASNSRGAVEVIERLWQFAVTLPGPDENDAETEVVAFVDIYAGPSSDVVSKEEYAREWRNIANWHFEFVRFPLSSPNDFVRLLGHDVNGSTHEQLPTHLDPIRTAFRLDYPLLASVGTDIYTLRLEEENPQLYVSQRGSDQLLPVRLSAALPGLERRPDFVEPEPFPIVFPELMRSLEDSATFGGLFSVSETLYFLSRKPAENRSPEGRETVWTLSVLRPIDGDPTYLEVAGSAVINGLSAPHLSVAASEQVWAFIEKREPVRYRSQQDIPSMYLVPGDQIEAISAQKATFICPGA